MSRPTSLHSPTSTASSALSIPEKQLARDADRAAEYGGDDPRDPRPKEEGAKPVGKAEEKLDGNRVGWDGPSDPANPKNWSVGRRWGITLICVLMTLNATFASSAPSSSVVRIALEFGVSTEVGYLVTSVFLCGYVVGPLLWGPGSELYGRRIVLRVSLISYFLFHLGQALATNITTLLITRFLTGVFGSSPLTICAGVIVDVWDPVNLGRATVLFSAGVFFGPVLGPVAGGLLANSSLDWRWVFWVMMIFAGVCITLVLLFIPETYAPVLLQRKAERLRKADPKNNAELYAEHERSDWSVNGVLHRTLYRPVKMLINEPILLLITIYISLVYGILYALFQAIPFIFLTTRRFDIGQAGLIFIGVGIGTTIGAFLSAPLSKHYPQLTVKWRGFPPPEERLYGPMIGAPLLIIGSLWLGWTGQYASIHWVVPALATIPIGAGIALIFNGFLSYLMDTYRQYAASAFSANVIVRSLVGAAFPLFTVQMYQRLGINWACTLVAACCLVLAPIPILFYKYGAWIRTKSKFSPSPDLQIAKQIAAEAAAATSTGAERV
ncbi:MFS polyamine transporter [Daedaleopsis nitida]|nr:MFS polyamine transporter [Daedaleopsis nitida]